MKNRDVPLDRLFQAARSVPAPGAPGEMPAHLKTRVLAHWRTAADDMAALSLAAWFRTALVCAGMVMLACAAWSYADLSPSPHDDEAVANYELREELRP